MLLRGYETVFFYGFDKSIAIAVWRAIIDSCRRHT